MGIDDRNGGEGSNLEDAETVASLEDAEGELSLENAGAAASGARSKKELAEVEAWLRKHRAR